MQRECKLIFRDDALAPRILEILCTTPVIGGYSAQGKQEWIVEDIYFDTLDLSLERLGCVGRVRTVGQNRYLELKKRTVDVSPDL